MKFTAIVIATLQVLDIVIHAITNQLELIRVTSNMVIVIWLAVFLAGKWNARFLSTTLGAIGIYLLLNMIFLVDAGIYNMEQGGGLRVTLFLLMFLTIALSASLIYMRNKTTEAHA